MATDDATSGRIYIKDLPETGSDYEGWRFTFKSQILRVAPDPVAAMAYIRELHDEAVFFGDLASNLSVNMNKTDVNVFAAVVAACQKGKKGPEILKLIQSRAQFGCGRQAVRIVDQRHLHESTHLATEANTKIQELSCSGLSELDSYMASFSLLRHQMGSGEHKFTNAGAHHSEEAAAAAAAGGKSQGGKGKHKSKKGSDKPCEHCHNPGHTAQKRWLNPKSSAYRPDVAAKINGSSASSSNGGPSAPPGLGAASIGARTRPAVPTDVTQAAETTQCYNIC